MNNMIARHFLSRGIQNWGQSAAERQAAKDSYLTAAGFTLDADRGAAEWWLDGVLDAMPRGKFEREVDYLAAAIEQRVRGAS
jgi:hypothetical protein